MVERLAADLRAEFPDLRGFSADNLWQMRQFYAEYSAPEFLAQAVPELPNRPGQFLARAVPEIPGAPATRIYYLLATAQFGWSRSVLLNQVKARVYERAVKENKTHNFALALPEYLAEQADEIIKSSYHLEFLGLERALK